ncbi:Pseudouridine-5'-phosphate glycosidase [Streptomyces violaceorubidus]
MLVVSEEVREAMDARRPVVALESTIIAHGLPRPRNLLVARELEEAVRQEGAVPATIAVLDGRPHVGLDKEQLERVANEDAVRKLGHRDLPLAVACGASGATTVSATALLAALAGVRVFATGGLGGVHREWTVTQDESADLGLLARTRITVVCAGVKSILDVPATLQRLETLGVSVAGYRTDRFPGFYLSDSGHPVDWTLDDPEQVAAVMRAQDALDGPPSARSWSPTRCPRRSSSIRRSTRACSLTRCTRARRRGSRARRSRRSSSSAWYGSPTAPRSAPTWRPCGGTGAAADQGRRGLGRGVSGAPGGALLVVGDVVTDVVARHRGPLAAGTDTAASVRRLPGGAGANVACSGRARRVREGAAAGPGGHRRLCMARTGAGGVRGAAAPRRRSGGAHGDGHLLVDTADSAERTFLTDGGASLRIGPDDSSDALLDGVGRLHLSGYLLFAEPSRALVSVALSAARARGVRVSLDPASAGFLTALGVDRFLGLVEGVDVLLPSRDEACLLTGLPDPADAAAKLTGTFRW